METGYKFLTPRGTTTYGGEEFLYNLPRRGEEWGPWTEHPEPADPDDSPCGPGRLHVMLRPSAVYAPNPWWAWLAQWDGEVGRDEDKVAAHRVRLKMLRPDEWWEVVRKDCPYAYLRGAHLRGAYLPDANLRFADLCNANLLGANLRGADLHVASLERADLCNANLRGADLRDASLDGADLRNANLRGADLCDAMLRDANLRGADLRGAMLCGAILPPDGRTDR